MSKYFNNIKDLPAFFYSVKFEKKSVVNKEGSETSININKRNSKQVRIGAFFKPMHPINLNNE